MALGKRLINTGAEAACNTDSVQAFGADNAYSSNKLLYQFENNVTNDVGSPSATNTGATFSSTAKLGSYSADFGGTTEHIDTGYNTDDTSLTHSFWMYQHSITGSYNAILGTYWDGGSGVYGYYLWCQDGTTLNWRVHTSNADYVQVAGTIALNAWHHVVLTWADGVGASIYIDGSLAQFTASSSARQKNDETITLGNLDTRGVSTVGYDGLIDQYRYYNKAVSDSDAYTLYSETTDTVSNTNLLGEGAGVALYTLDYDASEASGYYDGTPSNVDFGVGGKINTGVRFKDATDSFISTSLLFTGTGAKSFSFWFKANSVSSTNSAFYFSNNGGRIDVHIAGTGSNTPSASYQTVSINSTTAITGWNFVTLVFSGWLSSYSSYSYHGPAITCKVYLNGGSVQTVSPLPYNGSKELHLGGLSGSSSNYDGSLDQFRVFNKELSTDEIDTLYAETACTYTATANTADFPSSATAVAHYPLDNSAEDNKGTNDGTETDIEYTFGRFGQAAVFDGTSSEIIASSFTSLSQVGISMWVNMPDISQQAGLIARYGTNREFAIYMYGGTLTASIYYNGNNGNATSITTSTYMSNDTWHHIAYTANGSTAPKLYIDGIEVGTPQYTASAYCAYYTSSEPLDIGHFAGISAYNYEGKIDQVRIFSAALTSSEITELYNEKPETDTSNFKTVLYEGTAANRYISNVGMDLETSGGLVWIKNRSNSSGYYHALIDSVRGVGKVLSSNTYTTDSTTYTDQLTSLDANGFFVGNNSSGGNYVNLNGDDYVGWVWKGGGDAVLNEVGNIDSQVSANTAAGFSMVKYTGNLSSGTTATAQSVGHGLDAPPDLIIFKKISGASDWWVMTSELTNWSTRLELNDTSGTYDYYSQYPMADPTSDVFYTNYLTAINVNASDYIAYCWHSVAGYSKIGSYTGNDSTTGPSVTVGFRPSWVMIKKTSDTGSWYIFDAARAGSTTAFPKLLYPNLSNIEYDTTGTIYNGQHITTTATTFEVDFSSAWTDLNKLNETYLYMAFK